MARPASDYRGEKRNRARRNKWSWRAMRRVYVADRITVAVPVETDEDRRIQAQRAVRLRRIKYGEAA